MNADKQYYSFLGGLVSQKLDERVDMDKFGKWFKVADNMRFFSTGAMQNRTGFVKVANTKNNTQNDNIRLLSFVFNNREAFLLELGQAYMRVFKDGEPIKNADGNVYEVATDIQFPIDEDLKYAQSGDVIFLAIKSKGVYEIKRLKADGSRWSVGKSDIKIWPAGEENTDKDQKITLTGTTGTSYFTGSFPGLALTYGYPAFGYCYGKGIEGAISQQFQWYGIQTPPTAFASLNDLCVEAAQRLISDSTLSVSGNDLVIKVPSTSTNYRSNYSYGLRIFQLAPKINQSTLYNFAYVKQPDPGGYINKAERMPTKVVFNDEVKNLYPTLAGVYEVFGEDITGKQISQTEFINALNLKISTEALGKGLGNWPIIQKRKSIVGYCIYAKGNEYDAYCEYRDRIENGPVIIKGLSLVGGTEGELYDATTSKPFFNTLSVGEQVSIRHRVDSRILAKQMTSGKDEYLNGASNKWRVVTSGNWTGSVTLSYYSISDNSWHIFRNIYSLNADQPTNDNASGEITGDDLINYKINFGGSGTCRVNFTTDSAEVKSVFELVDREGDLKASLRSIKNSPSTKIESINFSGQALSAQNGWPDSVGFYQNRLFFGKDFNLYGSKTNDFWDFYEPVAVNDDDPINMSLLSYKVNEIVNIVTLKSFFVFTAGGEFGIGSSGALTQKDKFLKQYSAHGSARCLPIVAGNMIMFVDTSEHTVRAFQYSFETDTYEAQDISVLLDEIIKGEKITSTAYSSNEKECYFLTEKGEIFVLKFFPEQNILAWSKWKHAKYQIKNICVMPRGSEEDLYIAVNTEKGMQIERLTKDFYADSVNVYKYTEDVSSVSVPFAVGEIVVVNDGINKYNAVVSDTNEIKLARPAKTIYVGLAYKSQAALLAPVTMLQDGSATTYNLRKTFKAHFKYSNSYGFKVGVYGHEQMLPNYQDVNQTIDNETVLTTGKKSVLMPSRYDMQGSVSFVQEQPYPMIIENIMLEIDYGNR